MKPSELDDFLHRNKMTGKELAAKLDVHYVTVSRWRNGREQIPKTVDLALKWIDGEGGLGKMANTTNNFLENKL
jgi:plasmid maintenance system antidote protein VapI